MQDLIAGYLFKHGKYVLPQAGTLVIRTNAAQSVFGERKITAPVPYVEFIEEHGNAEDEKIYIAESKNISTAEARHLLTRYTKSLLSSGTGEYHEIRGVGKFHIDSEGKLLFVPEELQARFLPDVKAEKVIHPDSSHAILVGDKESNSTAMTEYFTDDVIAKPDRRWLWALLFFALAAALIIIYMNDKNGNSLFGNAQKTEAHSDGPTYKKLP